MDNNILALVVIVLGLLGVLAGYKIFKIYLAVSSFLIGFNFTWQFLSNQRVEFWMVLAGAMLVGFILALISFALYRLGIFILAVAIITETVRFMLTSLGVNLGDLTFWISLAIGVVVGVIALILRVDKFLIILATSVVGSAYAIMGINIYLQGKFELTNANIFNYLMTVITGSPILLISFLALVAIGILVQIKK
jgi:hypothetical protein